MRNFAHLPASTSVPASVASYLGRNDAAVNLALEIVGSKRPLDVAILGSGLFEPVSLAASKRLATGSLVAVYDSSPEVILGLSKLFTRSEPFTKIRTAVDPWPASWRFPKHESEAYLQSLGVNTNLLWDKTGRCTVGLRPLQIEINEFDILRIADLWQAANCHWDPRDLYKCPSEHFPCAWTRNHYPLSRRPLAICPRWRRILDRHHRQPRL